MPPPPAPRGVVEERRVYPLSQGAVAEWTLTDGTLVVYAQRPDVEGAHVVALAPGGAVLADAPAPSAADALGAIRRTPVDGVVVVAGAESVERFESRLRRVSAASRPASTAAPPPPGRRVSVDADDDGVVRVLAEALRRRARSAQLAFDPTGPAVTLTGGAVDLGPISPGEADAARAAVVADALRSPEAFAAHALADLYRLPGRRRPARAPAFAVDRLRRIRAVTARSLSSLAARLSATPTRD